MRLAPKIALVLGAVFLLVGIAGMAFGGSELGDVPPESEDWSGTLKWEGETPSGYYGHFEWTAIYNVWVEEGSEVSVEVVDGGADNRFITCEELDDCGIFDVDGDIPGFQYIGEIWIDDSGWYEIRFTDDEQGSSGVMIREDPSVMGILGAIGGAGFCCGGVFLLALGATLSFTMQDKPKYDSQGHHLVENDGTRVILSEAPTRGPKDGVEQGDGAKWWVKESEKE